MLEHKLTDHYDSHDVHNSHGDGDDIKDGNKTDCKHSYDRMGHNRMDPKSYSRNKY